MPEMRVEPPSPFGDPLLRGPISNANLALRTLGRGPFAPDFGPVAGRERSRGDAPLTRPYSMPVMPAAGDFFGAVEESFRATSAPSSYFDNLPLDLSDLLHSEHPHLPHREPYRLADHHIARSPTTCCRSAAPLLAALPKDAISAWKIEWTCTQDVCL